MKKGIRLDNTDLISLALITCLCISKIASFSEYTSIVTDEVQYKEIILGLKEPHLFNPAYYKIYEIVKYAKGGWYLGIRLLNLLFMFTTKAPAR